MYAKQIVPNIKTILIPLIIAFILVSCARQAVMVTTDSKDSGSSHESYAILGDSVETGGALLHELCSSDIEKIISFAHLKPDHGKKIKALICEPSASPQAFKKYFYSLPSKEKARLIRAFEFYGYNINGYGC